jgi:hypothetical protein
MPSSLQKRSFIQYTLSERSPHSVCLKLRKYACAIRTLFGQCTHTHVKSRTHLQGSGRTLAELQPHISGTSAGHVFVRGNQFLNLNINSLQYSEKSCNPKT